MIVRSFGRAYQKKNIIFFSFVHIHEIKSKKQFLKKETKTDAKQSIKKLIKKT